MLWMFVIYSFNIFYYSSHACLWNLLFNFLKKVYKIMFIRFCVLPNIEEKVKKHIKAGNISTRWINLYAKEEAIESICNNIIYHYSYKMFNFTEYLNNLYVKTQMYHSINTNDITKALMNKGFNIEFFTKDVMKIRK